MKPVEMCASLFLAFEKGDFETVRKLCSADMQATQNNGSPMNLETLLSFTAAVLAVVSDFRYEDARRSATEDGFVEEHLVRGTLPILSEVTLVACIVGEVKDGKIVKIREYVDSAAAGGLIKALSAGG